jgi:hypothetical protein
MRAGDRMAARRLLALQFTFVDAGGKIHVRRDFLGEIKSVAAAASADAKVRSYGELAMVTGHRKAADNNDAFFLDIWARQKGSWHALLMQNVAAAQAEPLPAAPAAAGGEPKQHECKNPCQAIPYRVRSAAEQDVINAYQAIVKAIVAHDANEWAKHVADEFVAYASSRAPLARSSRSAAIEDPNRGGVGEVQTMRLAVYGDGAVMTATESSDPHPPYRAARVFVKRDGRWLMAATAQTDVKSR